MHLPVSLIVTLCFIAVVLVVYATVLVSQNRKLREKNQSLGMSLQETKATLQETEINLRQCESSLTTRGKTLQIDSFATGLSFIVDHGFMTTDGHRFLLVLVCHGHALWKTKRVFEIERGHLISFHDTDGDPRPFCHVLQGDIVTIVEAKIGKGTPMGKYLKVHVDERKITERGRQQKKEFIQPADD